MRETDARPLVSVIIPVFNRTESLAGAISSVQAQTMSDWELIVVDDCSMHPLDAMIESLHDPRIRLLRHEANRGVSAARNTGLDAANGRLVAFLDSDDGWLPNKLLEQNRLIAGHSSPKNVICVTQTIVMRSKNDCVIFPISGPRPDQTIAEFLYAEDGGFAQVSSFCLALETARRVRFNEALNQYEDQLFLIEAMAAGVQYALVPEALSIWSDDERSDRLGAKDSLSAGRDFLAIAGPLVSPRAYSAFEARCLGPSLWRENAGAALRTFYSAHRRGGLSPAQAMRLMARCCLPDSTLRRVRERVNKWHKKTGGFPTR